MVHAMLVGKEMATWSMGVGGDACMNRQYAQVTIYIVSLI
jgi:hypothetical protein